MTVLHHHATSKNRIHLHGGQRLKQPQEREHRKVPQPKDLISMPGGSRVRSERFHELRSTSHQKLNGSLDGCAKRVEASISSLEWKQIDAWMAEHRNPKRHIDHANDHLMAVLLDHAGGRMDPPTHPEGVLRMIEKNRTAALIIAQVIS